MTDTDIFSEEAIRAGLKDNIIGHEIVFYEKTSSTNEKAMETALNAQPGNEFEGTEIGRAHV